MRRSEERFQSLARNAFELVTVTDAKGVILYESPALERVLGYIETGKSEGAELLCGGHQMTDGVLAKGNFVGPTVSPDGSSAG